MIGSKMSRTADCKVCYGPHDDEIHEATLRVRRWFHDHVTRNFDDGFDPNQELEDPELESEVA